MKLLEPIQVGKITLKNRIMFPPMTTGYEERDGSIGKQSFNFYKRIAEGGASYIVLGDVAPLQTASPTPKLFKDEQIEIFKNLADALHVYDCKLGLQVFHPEYDVAAVGRMIMQAGQARGAAAKAQAEGNKEEAEKQTALAGQITKDAYAKLHHDMQHFVSEATHDQLKDIYNKIGACASKAYQAGVDVIEVHGDRIIGSLCSTILNHRTDEYGGSFENRIRFALEVVDMIKECAPEICIDYKLPVVTINADGSLRGKGGLLIDEAVEFAKILEAHGVDMIHVGQANHTGNMNDTIPVMGTMPYCFMEEYSKKIKEAVSIPVSTVGRILNVDNANRLIEEGVCDIVGLGRSLLCDPDFVKKCENGQVNRIRQCMMCNKGCTDAIQSRRFLSCVLNAENGYEYDRVITPADTKKKVVVVGGGVAGMEAARVAAMKGHDVVLFEKTDKLGGQIKIAAVPPRKSEMLRSIAYLENELKELNVDIRLNSEVCAHCVDKENPDAVIVAVGASNVMLNIEGSTQDHVYNSWKVLAKEQVPTGKVTVIGGGLVGAETAEFLANNGCDVTIVEMLDEIAKDESSTVKPTMMKDFADHNVKQYTNTKVTAITQNTVEAQTENGQVSIETDYVVMAVGAKPNTFDMSLLTEKGIEVHVVGDCNEKAADINRAIEEGYLAANAI